MLHAFRGGSWFSYAFLLDQYDAEKRRLGWSYGGFQGGEGCDVAEAWWVENDFRPGRAACLTKLEELVRKSGLV